MKSFTFRSFRIRLKSIENAILCPDFSGYTRPTLTLKRVSELERREREGGGSFPGSYLLWDRWLLFFGGRRVDCNIESVTGRCSWSAVVKAVVDADRGWHICSHRAGPLRIITAAKDPLCCGIWSDQFIVDILTRKEYKAGISIR